MQVLNRGVSPKAGIQYGHVTQRFTVFSWVVAETLRDPNIDYFLLCRATPPFGTKLDFFSQIELVNSFPTRETSAFSFTQRIRMGCPGVMHGMVLHGILVRPEGIAGSLQQTLADFYDIYFEDREIYRKGIKLFGILPV